MVHFLQGLETVSSSGCVVELLLREQELDRAYLLHEVIRQQLHTVFQFPVHFFHLLQQGLLGECLLLDPLLPQVQLADLFKQKTVVAFEVLVFEEEGLLDGAEIVHAGISEHGAPDRSLFLLRCLLTLEDTFRPGIC